MHSRNKCIGVSGNESAYQTTKSALNLFNITLYTLPFLISHLLLKTARCVILLA